MTQDKAPDAVIIAFRLKRMMGAHSWEELMQIASFREDVDQLVTTTLDN